MEVLRCPSCGAPVDCKAVSCSYCRAELHPVRCPWCFAWTYAETRDCPSCGAVAAPPADAKKLSCPSCRKALSARAIGRARLAGCARCSGVWADEPSFRAICDDRATQAAYLGDGSALPRPETSDPMSSPVLYRPCPDCEELMNRFNFAGCSGVILDACKPHGVWFDADELKKIVEFIRGGGLDVARTRERESLEFERRRLENAAVNVDRFSMGLPREPSDSIASARSLIDILFGGLKG